MVIITTIIFLIHYMKGRVEGIGRDRRSYGWSKATSEWGAVIDEYIYIYILKD